MFSCRFENYKASFDEVTIYKVRESGVEKEICFHVRLKQIREFFVTAFRVFLPNNFFAIIIWTIVNTE
jgi:hypothetical protein